MLTSIIIVFLLVHFGSSSSALMWPYDHIEKLIKQDVADEAHRKQALEIIEQMKAANKAYDKERGKSVDAVTKLASVRATPVAEIDRAAQPMIAEDRATAQKLVDLRFQLKAVMTANEWAKVFPAPTAAGAKKSAAETS
jgi:hypothetical protein